MLVLSDLLVAIAHILDFGFTVLYWILLIRVLISWINPDPYNPLVQFLYKITEPILSPIRSILHLRFGIDISPLIAFLIIFFLRSFLIRILFILAMRLR